MFKVESLKQKMLLVNCSLLCWKEGELLRAEFGAVLIFTSFQKSEEWFDGSQIDAIAITFDKGLREGDVFTKMKSLSSETTNTLLTDFVYFGRLANANIIAGRFEESEDMLRAARCKAVDIGLCHELLDMFYNEVQVRLYSFENTPTVEERQALLMWGRRGHECAKENLACKKGWRRTFVLRMVFCLLGLGTRAKVIENCLLKATLDLDSFQLTLIR
ncbi:hypothetical protein MAR_023600 [Mya arenaria]|uniref:Uncharacterized protein n=1 Tax=Mya arenaria TaxID=6604 RepID=A0ABY7DR76_MYAAR|nr:hypothetical protein MAR_023600 [Mya arenaria]